MPDHGPIYLETIKHLRNGNSHWLVEPWNAASALIFILIALFWFYRLRGKYIEHAFLTYGAVLIFIGGIGGTLYHALRTEPIYLAMDWMPIAILTLSAVLWFLSKIIESRVRRVLIAIAGFAVVRLTFYLFIRAGQLKLGITAGYLVMGIYVLAPIVLYLKRTNFKHSLYVLFAFLSFLAAAYFRFSDLDSSLPMGSHFLWHVFGALATGLLLEYVWKVSQKSAVTN